MAWCCVVDLAFVTFVARIKNRMSAPKRALRETMDLLDEEVESGNVKGGAHIRLAKSLKGVFEATDECSERGIIVKYLIEQLIDYPETICKTTERLAHTMRCPKFLCRLVTAKQKSMAEGKQIEMLWWKRLMRGLIEPDDAQDHDERDTRCDISDALDMVNHGQDALAFVENRLDELMHRDDWVYLKKLFPLGPPGSEEDHARPGPSEPEWPNVWNLITIDPRFSAYLRCSANWTKEEDARLKAFHDRFLPSSDSED